MPSGYNVDTFSSSSNVTLPPLGRTINSPWSYSLPYNVAPNKPSARNPSVPAVKIAVPGVNVLLIAIAIGWPGASISKR